MTLRTMLRPLPVAAAALLAFAARDARATEDAAPPAASVPPLPENVPPSEQFGQRGHLVISTGAALSVAHSSDGGLSTTSLLVEPAADYFVANHLSVGGVLLFSYSATSDSSGPDHNIEYGIGPRVGLDVPITSSFSLWPRATLLVENLRQTNPEFPTTSTSREVVDLYVPVLFHPAPHFLVGFGPYLDLIFENQTSTTNENTTTVGAKLVLGGWAGV